jgi:hypothetical protein
MCSCASSCTGMYRWLVCGTNVVSIGGRRRNLCALGVRCGLSLITMADDAADRFSALHAVRDADESSFALLTIKDVAVAALLPQPVVAQLVSRVWTREGWMYSGAACREAVQLGARVRGERTRPPLDFLDGQA